VTLGASVGYADGGNHPEKFWQHYGEGQPSPSRDSVQFGALPPPGRCSEDDGDKNCGGDNDGGRVSGEPFGTPSNTVRNPAPGEYAASGTAQGALAPTDPPRLLQPHTADPLD
jgi:hypothetical protein